MSPWTRLPRWARVALGLGFFFFLVPWFSVQVLPASWTFIFGAWAAWMLWFAFGRPGRTRRALWFNIGVAFLALAGAELYLEFQPPTKASPRSGAHRGYTRPDADLGYAPVPGVRRTIAYCFGDEKILEVTYTIDERGCRIGPPSPSPTAPSVVFFGGSYTYGQPIEDHETIANQVGELTEGRFTPVNLAFFGYGPHQMLAMLQSGRAEAVVERTPSHAFYLAIGDHARRVAGQVHWDMAGPRYRLMPDGTVRRDGQFDEGVSSVQKRLRKWLRASNIAHLFLFRKREITQDQRDLLAAVVRASRDRIAEIWPGCRFHVLLWDHPRPTADLIASALEAQGIEVHRVSEALPGFEEYPARYAAHAHDPHPSADAARGIAAWIVREFLENP